MSVDLMLLSDRKNPLHMKWASSKNLFFFSISKSDNEIGKF